jgi:hypothetical protein
MVMLHGQVCRGVRQIGGQVEQGAKPGRGGGEFDVNSQSFPDRKLNRFVGDDHLAVEMGIRCVS